MAGRTCHKELLPCLGENQFMRYLENAILVAFRVRAFKLFNDKAHQFYLRLLLHVFLFICPQNLHFHCDFFGQDRVIRQKET